MKKKIQKPFDVQAAKRGARIETREGRSLRILCYDKFGTDYPIVALISHQDGESCNTYTIKGEVVKDGANEDDLVIVEEVEVSKFSVGDWLFVKSGSDNPWFITAVSSTHYELQSIQGCKKNVAQITVDNNYRLWTLKDAKSGDVLTCEDGRPFIFKELRRDAPSAYCGINVSNSIFICCGGVWTHESVRPATHEEKQQLFNKLEEEGYKWDAETLTLSKIQKRWRDNENTYVNGYFIDSDSEIEFLSLSGCNTPINHNVFTTKKQAKSALAMARISQIMANDKRFGGVVTDEEWDGRYWFSIIRIRNILVVEAKSSYEFLAFHTTKQADLFLEENKDLVKDYYMLG